MEKIIWGKNTIKNHLNHWILNIGIPKIGYNFFVMVFSFFLYVREANKSITLHIYYTWLTTFLKYIFSTIESLFRMTFFEAFVFSFEYLFINLFLENKFNSDEEISLKSTELVYIDNYVFEYDEIRPHFGLSG